MLGDATLLACAQSLRMFWRENRKICVFTTQIEIFLAHANKC